MTIQSASMDNNRLILVAGEPASGKSTLGRSLARRLGAAYLDMDTISFPFLERCIREDHGFKDSARYRDHYRDAEYRSLLATAADNLATGIESGNWRTSYPAARCAMPLSAKRCKRENRPRCRLRSGTSTARFPSSMPISYPPSMMRYATS